MHFWKKRNELKQWTSKTWFANFTTICWPQIKQNLASTLKFSFAWHLFPLYVNINKHVEIVVFQFWKMRALEEQILHIVAWSAHRLSQWSIVGFVQHDKSYFSKNACNHYLFSQNPFGCVIMEMFEVSSMVCSWLARVEYGTVICDIVCSV